MNGKFFWMDGWKCIYYKRGKGVGFWWRFGVYFVVWVKLFFNCREIWELGKDYWGKCLCNNFELGNMCIWNGGDWW